MIYCFLFVIAGGIISLYKCFRPDGLLLTIPKYLFYFLTLITRKLCFFIVPVIISALKHNIMCAVSFFSAFIVLWAIYLLLNKLYSKHSMSYYGFPQHLALNLWDLKVLRLTYSASCYSLGFKDFIYQYLFELTHEDDLHEESSKPLEADNKPATDNEPEPNPTTSPKSSSDTKGIHVCVSFTPTGLLEYALDNYRKDKNRDKLAAEITSQIFRSIERLEVFPLFEKNLTNILVINVSSVYLLRNMIRDLDISHALADQTSIYLQRENYSKLHINKSAEKSSKIVNEKFGLVTNLLKSEFSITTSGVYKDDKYISRYVEHIMMVVFSSPYDKGLYDALTRTYKDICELHRAYDEYCKKGKESINAHTTPVVR